MRADWTASGACTSGSAQPPRGANRRVSGGAATTSTTKTERVSRGTLTTPVKASERGALMHVSSLNIEQAIEHPATIGKINQTLRPARLRHCQLVRDPHGVAKLRHGYTARHRDI